MSTTDLDAARTHLSVSGRFATAVIAIVAVIVGTMLPFTAMSAAAAPGSLVSGMAWADTDSDGVHDADEVARAGVVVNLVSSPGGAIILSTTTAANGTYSFANVADGDYAVRMDAPGPFAFPAGAGGDNDFADTGAPAPGDPRRGRTAPFTISGATQVTGLDAGLRPIATLTAERTLIPSGACEGYAVTGTEPWDAADGPGEDSTASNCRVRTGDTVTQTYSVGLTGLPTGASVPNVIAEFTISSPDDGIVELVGPGAGGMPSGCLSAPIVNPSSSFVRNLDGSITVRCNIGALASNVTALQIGYRFTTDTPIPSHASIEMHAYAAAGEAGESPTVAGPLVEVTGAAEWDLEKTFNGNPGPDFTEMTIDGQVVEGYKVRYVFQMFNRLPEGGSELDWPVTFTDEMPNFPTARIMSCNPVGVQAGTSNQWNLTCPIGEQQGADGWPVSIAPADGIGGVGPGGMLMEVFVPLEDMNRYIDPTWQPGQPAPEGEFTIDNRAVDTETWAMNGGALNYGDGHEPGWDGTGNNIATREASAEEAIWDLSKAFDAGPAFATRNGVDGYYVDYRLQVTDLAGSDNVAPWLDRPVTFKDALTSHPGAILDRCWPHGNNTALQPICETGVTAGADGWDISVTPNENGFNARFATIVAHIFIPLNEFPQDPCVNNVTMDLRNEATDSEHWTAQGIPNNVNSATPGFEPGWDGTTATGNNLAVNSVRPSAQECGTLTGDKVYVQDGQGAYSTDPNIHDAQYAGQPDLSSLIYIRANNNRVSATNLQLCDVFDVSTQQLRPGARAAVVGVNGIDASQYVLEYAIGPNQTDTQIGTGVNPANNLWDSDPSSLNTAAQGCRTFAGPWVTDPASFGSGWENRVNMVRWRPLDPQRTETGPFSADMYTPIMPRSVYNGGPNDGEIIPGRIRLANAGAWPSQRDGSQWSTVVRERRTTGPGLAVGKSITQTQYLPGTQAIWDLAVRANNAVAGMTMLDLKVIDTLPPNLHYDRACTEGRLPAGVTASYDATTRRVTFSAGDFAITTANQWFFHPTLGTVPALQICTMVDSLAQPGDTYNNTVQATALNSENAPTANATIQVVGAGQMGITKSVDKPYVASGEQYNWFLDWGNTSADVTFLPPDLIDVLPWTGDGGPGSLSQRAQYGSDYQGLAQLTGPLAAPAYTRGGTGGAVPGTWYYSVANPATINHDPRVPANANPQAPGGPWLTAAEVVNFGAVTAVRFVSSQNLPAMSRVRAVIPQVSTSTALDNLYVNRGTVFSQTFPNQLLLSNEPFVQIPGFTLGDLIWIDRDGDGAYTDGVDEPMAGVTVEVLNDEGDVVGTATTDADGRWSVAALPEGTYRARIPASMFQDGGPLELYAVKTVGSEASDDQNENVSNDNTATPDPAATGLTSTPITLAYVRNGAGTLTGGTGPTGDDVAGLAGELIADDFTNFTIDLALAPVPAVDIEKYTNTVDADDPTGPFIGADGVVRWTYTVTNTGSTDLFNLTVTDDKVAAAEIDCDGTGSNVIPGPLAEGESFDCVATGTPIVGQYANLGTVTATGPEGEDGNGDPIPGDEVSDEDRSHYFGSVPAVRIVKSTNGRDADTAAEGPQIPVGDAVTWTYVVTNTGNVDLFDIVVTDDRVATTQIDCAGGTTNTVAGPLAPGASVECTARGTATLGQYENLGTVTAVGPQQTGPEGEPIPPTGVTDDNPSHYYGVPPTLMNRAALAMTGGNLDLMWVYAAAAVLAGAAMLVVMRVRRRREEGR